MELAMMTTNGMGRLWTGLVKVVTDGVSRSGIETGKEGGGQRMQE